MFKRLFGVVVAALLLFSASAQGADYRWDFQVNWFYGSPPVHSADGYVTFSAASPQGKWTELKDFGLTIGNTHYSMSDVELSYGNGQQSIGASFNGGDTIWTGYNDFWASFDQNGLRALTYSSLNIWGGVWDAGSFSSRLSVLPVAAPVPEPETYAMSLAGLGLMGFVARRRKA